MQRSRFAIGCIEQLNDAAEYAFQAGKDDLLKEIEEKIEEIKSESI